MIPVSGDEYIRPIKRKVSNSELNEPLGTPAGYSCWQMLTVKSAAGLNRIDGCIPLILLPKSLIGKTVKVTIEECT